MKICELCGQGFAPTSNRAKHCDACCTHRCRECGASFYRRRVRRYFTPMFCTNACQIAWQRRPEQMEVGRERTLARLGEGETVACGTCDKAIYRKRCRLGVGTAYCSNRCRRAAVSLECPICGEAFTRPPSDLRKVNYCSDECRNAGTLIRRASGDLPTIKTSLEVAGAAILDTTGAVYAEQAVIGDKFTVDVLIPSAGIVIQWDGDFWHGNPARHEDEALTHVQRKNVARDRSCNAYLEKCGYRVLRFWESDVHGRPSWVSGEIARALASSEST